MLCALHRGSIDRAGWGKRLLFQCSLLLLAVDPLRPSATHSWQQLRAGRRLGSAVRSNASRIFHIRALRVPHPPHNDARHDQVRGLCPSANVLMLIKTFLPHPSAPSRVAEPKEFCAGSSTTFGIRPLPQPSGLPLSILGTSAVRTASRGPASPRILRPPLDTRELIRGQVAFSRSDLSFGACVVFLQSPLSLRLHSQLSQPCPRPINLKVESSEGVLAACFLIS